MSTEEKRKREPTKKTQHWTRIGGINCNSNSNSNSNTGGFNVLAGVKAGRSTCVNCSFQH